MALIKCKECGAEVSSKAETCPKCGARVAEKPMGCGTLIGVAFLGVIIILIFSSIFSSPETSSRPSSDASAATASVGTQSLPGSQWSYYQNSDDMGKGTVYTAYVSSTNTVNFDFPYSGEQHATLSLRTHPRWGKDLFFRIEKGQLLCNSYDGCKVLIRFDDGPALTFSAIEPEDNSSEVIFIQNYGRFVENMLKAKRVRIAVNVYQEGAPAFEFDVSDFDQAKYKPKT
jgi:hypothetical protein